jgi:hypothetical protein
MKAVADTLALARSNLIERVSRRAKWCRPYSKAGDNELLALIRRLVGDLTGGGSDGKEETVRKRLSHYRCGGCQ